jgi:hypothetical protein
MTNWGGSIGNMAVLIVRSYGLILRKELIGSSKDGQIGGSGRLPGREVPEAAPAVMFRSATSYLRLVTVGHPPSKELNAILRPGALSSWWGRRHPIAANAANAVVDDRCMRLDVIVACQVERLTHRPNVSFSEQWANVGLIARQSWHSPHLLE